MYTYTLALVAMLASGYSAETVQSFDTAQDCQVAAIVITKAYEEVVDGPVFVFHQCYQGYNT